MSPFFFCYRHLVEDRGLPEFPGLTCEKGIWWSPPDVEWWGDEEAMPFIWDFWKAEDPAGLAALFPDIEALKRYWRAWE